LQEKKNHQQQVSSNSKEASKAKLQHQVSNDSQKTSNHKEGSNGKAARYQHSRDISSSKNTSRDYINMGNSSSKNVSPTVKPSLSEQTIATAGTQVRRGCLEQQRKRLQEKCMQQQKSSVAAFIKACNRKGAAIARTPAIAGA